MSRHTPENFGVAPFPPPFPGGVAPKFGSEKVSRYTGVSQVQLRVSRYTVQLRNSVCAFFVFFCGFSVAFSWLFHCHRFGQTVHVLALESLVNHSFKMRRMAAIQNLPEHTET